MKLSKKILEYAKEHFDGVRHTTLNPEGPGVVRIHLVPPKITDETTEDEIGPSVVILNGQDIIPLDVSWTILMCEFIDEVNRYHGRKVNELEMLELSRRYILSDIRTIMTTFKQVAYREEVTEEIPYMNIGDYAPYMKAPHRMDLLVSSLNKEGNWHCNLKCVHCYAAGQEHSKEQELTTSEWMIILEKLQEIGIPQVTFTGGEPTMRSDLIELVDHAKWFVTRLNTNGINLTEEYCRRLKEASLDSIQITLYSSDREIHNRLVGADGYDRTVNGIKNALSLGMSVSINTPLCTENQDYVKTLAFLHDMGVLYVTCSGIITTGNAARSESENLQLSREKISEILKNAVQFCAENGMEISFTSPGWVEESLCEELGIAVPNCGACLSNMAITPSGKVVPCQSWLSGQPLGRILGDEWGSIWESEECKKRRDYSAAMYGECPLRRQRGEVAE